MNKEKQALQKLRATFQAMAAEAETGESDARGARNYAEAARCQVTASIWREAASEVYGAILEAGK